MPGYDVGDENKCPWCQTFVHFITPGSLPRAHGPNEPTSYDSKAGARTESKEGSDHVVSISECPHCHNPLISLKHGDYYRMQGVAGTLLYPGFGSGVGGRRAPNEVPEPIRNDFEEASVVIIVSEKASAAISRRCLDAVLQDKNYSGDLNTKIDNAMKDLPQYLSENIDTIRQVGNFAAHTIKSKESGAIVDVEPDEAEFLLDVLEQLFDFYYVQPSKSKGIREKINKKAQSAGKPKLKGPRGILGKIEEESEGRSIF